MCTNKANSMKQSKVILLLFINKIIESASLYIYLLPFTLTSPVIDKNLSYYYFLIDLRVSVHISAGKM